MKYLIKKLYNKMTKVNNQQKELEYLITQGLKVGKNFHMNANLVIDSRWPWLISIGDDVTISSNVTILAHDASTNVVKCHTKLGKVEIGNNVFIGMGSIVLCNVHIGDNVVIGAGSVVTHDCPSNGVYAGNPAIRISSIADFEQKNRDQLKIRPYYAKIRPWYDWKNSSVEEREKMAADLDDGIGYV